MTYVPASAEEIANSKKESADFDPSRIHSLDAFRGIAVVVFLFLADLATAEGIPAWLQLSAQSGKLTLADLMFPLFIFIAGMAIPIAVIKRSDAGQAPKKIWNHMVFRCFSLVVIGLYIVNMPSFHQSSGIGYNLWTLLFYAGAILIWIHYPNEGKRRFLFMGLRLGGIVILGYLNLTYNGGNSGDRNMAPLWWGYPGLLGYTGLLAGSLYLLFKRNFPAMVACAGLLLSAALVLNSGDLKLEGMYELVVGNGNTVTYALIMVMGILPGMLFTGETQFSEAFRNRFLFVTAALLAVAGWLTSAMFGVSQANASPAWALYSSAICCIAFAILYFIVEVKKILPAHRFIERIGRNALLAFMLWGLILALLAFLGLDFLDTAFESGGKRIGRALALSLAVSIGAGFLSRMGIRMKL